MKIQNKSHVRRLSACLAAFALSVGSTGASAGEKTYYTYDAQGRLIKSVKEGGAADGQQKCIDYDASGNRTKRTVHASSCTPSGGGGGGGGEDPPSFAINDPAAVEEGNTITFTVTKTGAGAASVNYATAHGTAGSGDYVTKTGTLSFSSSETSKTIAVVTTTDALFEGVETFVVNLSGATGGATVSDAQGTGTILNKEDICTFGCM